MKSKFYVGYDNNVLNCMIAYNKYGGYCVPISSVHRPSAQKILQGKIHEPKTIEFIKSNCGNGDIVHAGSFFGDFLPALSKSIAKNNRIWAFEPNKESYRCASITVTINMLTNVVLFNAGLGENHYSSKILIKDKNGKALGGASKIIEYNNEKGTYQDIEILSIDKIISKERYISIIHLDVEGFEKQALVGALRTIKRSKPIIILETLPEYDWLLKNILNIGYIISGSVHNNSILKFNE